MQSPHTLIFIFKSLQPEVVTFDILNFEFCLILA